MLFRSVPAADAREAEAAIGRLVEEGSIGVLLVEDVLYRGLREELREGLEEGEPIVVDVLGADVYAFGLITDFRGLLFDGTRRMLEIADQRTEMQVEARCWCGARATNNARLVNDKVVFEGETVVVGDTATTRKEPLFGDVVRYELLCRYHYRRGQLTPNL